jgi:hypothetical protein
VIPATRPPTLGRLRLPALAVLALGCGSVPGYAQDDAPRAASVSTTKIEDIEVSPRTRAYLDALMELPGFAWQIEYDARPRMLARLAGTRLGDLCATPDVATWLADFEENVLRSAREVSAAKFRLTEIKTGYRGRLTVTFGFDPDLGGFLHVLLAPDGFTDLAALAEAYEVRDDESCDANVRRVIAGRAVRIADYRVSNPEVVLGANLLEDGSLQYAVFGGKSTETWVERFFDLYEGTKEIAATEPPATAPRSADQPLIAVRIGTNSLYSFSRLFGSDDPFDPVTPLSWGLAQVGWDHPVAEARLTVRAVESRIRAELLLRSETPRHADDPLDRLVPLASEPLRLQVFAPRDHGAWITTRFDPRPLVDYLYGLRDPDDTSIVAEVLRILDNEWLVVLPESLTSWGPAQHAEIFELIDSVLLGCTLRDGAEAERTIADALADTPAWRTRKRTAHAGHEIVSLSLFGFLPFHYTVARDAILAGVGGNAVESLRAALERSADEQTENAPESMQEDRPGEPLHGTGRIGFRLRALIALLRRLGYEEEWDLAPLYSVRREIEESQRQLDLDHIDFELRRRPGEARYVLTW